MEGLAADLSRPKTISIFGYSKQVQRLTVRRGWAGKVKFTLSYEVDEGGEEGEEPALRESSFISTTSETLP